MLITVRAGLIQSVQSLNGPQPKKGTYLLQGLFLITVSATFIGIAEYVKKGGRHSSRILFSLNFFF